MILLAVVSATGAVTISRWLAVLAAGFASTAVLIAIDPQLALKFGIAAVAVLSLTILALAVRGKMFSRDGWSHPPGSNLVAWTRREQNSQIVTILCGDGPAAYNNPAFRQLLGNAIRFVASDGARQ